MQIEGTYARADREDQTVEHRLIISAALVVAGSLLPFVRLDHFLDLPFYRLQVETGRRLHRRKLDGGLREFGHFLLHHHKPPKLARIKVVREALGRIIEGLSSERRRPLERVLPNVHHDRHIGSGFLSRPSPWLLEENILEVIDAKRSQVRPTEIEQLVTS